jgi:outer membrane protein TolC
MPEGSRRWAWPAALVLVARGLGAQPVAPVERLTLQEAIQRAVEANPTVAEARAGILRAEALLQQVRAGTLPFVTGTAFTTTINEARRFEDVDVTPQTLFQGSIDVGMPVLAATRWAARTQATDQLRIAEVNVEEVRRQLAIAAAEAYLTIIALRRVVDLNELAHDTSRAHYELSAERRRGGIGSRLNELRAQQELSTNETRVEEARLAVLRAQEALGVIVAANGPVDAAEEPVFEAPAEEPPAPEWMGQRTDLRLFGLREQAAERVVDDSWREWLPSVDALFQPQFVAPSNFFQPTRSWTLRFFATVPIFDSGARRGLTREREAALAAAVATRQSAEIDARSEVRVARAAIASADRALASARAASEQAAEVVRITDVSFRAGATSNIEVIDAQRIARDTDTAVAITEDQARRARLELLIALGRFP